MRTLLTGWILLGMALSHAAVGAEPSPLAAVEQYLAAGRSAKSNKDISRYWSKRRIKEEAKALKRARANRDREQRKMEVELRNNQYRLTAMMDLRDPVIVSEEKEGARTKLELTATTVALDKPGERSPTSGTVWLVRERGAWKIDDEQWKVSMGGSDDPSAATSDSSP